MVSEVYPANDPLSPIVPASFHKGTVQQLLNPTTAVIKTDTGTMTVTIDTDTLKSGDDVAVTVQGSNVVLVKIPKDAPPVADSLAFDAAMEYNELLAHLYRLRRETAVMNNTSSAGENGTVTIDHIIEMIKNGELPASSLFNQLIADLRRILSGLPGKDAQTVDNEHILKLLEEIAAAGLPNRASPGPAEYLRPKNHVVAMDPGNLPEEGFHHFPSLTQALAFLKRFGCTAAIVHNQGESIQNRNNPVILFCTSDHNDSKKVLFMNRDQAYNEIKQFLILETKNPASLHVPPEALMECLTANGSLPLGTLRQLEEYYAKASGDGNGPAVIRGEALTTTIRQLLPILITRYPKSDMPLESVFTGFAAKMTALLQNPLFHTIMDAMPEHLKSSLMMILNNMTVQDHPAPAFIETSLHTAGYFLEHDLFAAESGALQSTAPPVISNMKQFLLVLLEYFLSMKTTQAQDGGTHIGNHENDSPPGIQRHFTIEDNQSHQILNTKFAEGGVVLQKQLQDQIQHIEALQFMARQQNTLQGTQQLFVLPIRIDDTWHEVRIRFIKEYAKEARKRKANQISVQLTVSLSRYGDVNAFMKLLPQKKFECSLSFTDPLLHSWFEHQKEALSAELKGIGFKQLQMHFRLHRPNQDTEPPAFQTEHGGTTHSKLNLIG